ncbi:hypothetical protein [Agaribacter marinus]|uniref:MSHA biogenesis protein MshK n=1 Tax=Agaribacter marinus TaxID=1431249 RepID=A0AA37SZQ4_9ALTE|nr:hypothetical protein [Agaribacter marinus]GLR72232.1 hypothetical protein GCM10007852_31400 [Agaribacter marinus]
MLISKKRASLTCLLLLLAASVCAKQEKDPTKPPAAALAQLIGTNTLNKDIVLSAIFTRGQQRYAVINKRIMRIGDDILGKQIVSIDAQSIKLRNMTGSDTENDDMVFTLHEQTKTSGNMGKQGIK